MSFWYHNICCPPMTCTISSQQVTCETLALEKALVGLMNPDLIREVRPPTPIS